MECVIAGVAGGPLEAQDTCDTSRDPCEDLKGWDAVRDVWESQLWEVNIWLICACETKGWVCDACACPSSG